MYVFIDDSGDNTNKLFVGYIINNENKEIIEKTLNKILEGLKKINPQINEIHFVDFFHSKKDFYFCREPKIETKNFIIKNDKESRYSFFEFFTEQIMEWLSNGMIEAIFVSETNNWKDILSFYISEITEEISSLNIKKDYKTIISLLKKCANYVFEEIDDSELPVCYIADNYGNINKKEIRLDKEIFLGDKLIFENSNDNVLIQLADFLAFSYNRYTSSVDEKFNIIVKPLIDLIKK